MKKFIFVCFTYYHFFISNIYMNEIKNNSNAECWLIWDNFRTKKNDTSRLISRFENEWDKIIYLDYYEEDLSKNRIRQYIHRLKYYNETYGNKSKWESLFTNNRDCVLIIFSDASIPGLNILRYFKKVNKKNPVILIEEGLGLYNTNKFGKYPIYYRIPFCFIGVNTPKNMCIGDSELVDTIILYNPEKLPQDKAKGKKIIKQYENIIFSKENTVKFLNIFIKEEKNLSIIEPSDILYLGQPLVDVNIAMYQEINKLTEIFLSFSKETKIIIKPHPSDNISKYEKLEMEFENIKVIKGNLALIPVEVLFSAFKISCIITPFSSSAAKAKYILPHVNTYYIYKLFGINSSHMDSMVSKVLGPNDIIVENIGNIDSSLVKHSIDIPLNAETNNQKEDIKYLLTLMNN